MLTSVRLQDFKGHRDTTVRLGRLTLLVGPNGAGKSSVLQGLLLLYLLIRYEPQDVLRDDYSPGDLLHRASTGPITIGAEGTEDGIPWRLSASITPEELDAAPRRNRHLAVDWAHGETAGHAEDMTLPLRNQWQQAPLEPAVGWAVLYRFDARLIAAAARSDQVAPVIEMDGTNTAAVLATLKLEQEEVFNRIQAELRKIVPSVERIRFRRAQAAKGVIGHKIYLDLRGAPNVPAHAASEGTLVTLALLTALFSPNRPRLILLDDLDHALHPEAQVELVRQLKRLLAEMPDLQIVATTHSPYILDELDPADVQVFALRDDGSVATKRLSEHPEAASGTLTAGQLWSLDPERRWVAEEG